MVAWTDYKEAAKNRGSLALELYVVTSTPAGSAEAVKDNLQSHLAYQQEQEALGKLAFAGPLSDLSGEQMEGMGMICLLYTSPSPRDRTRSRMPSSA